MARKVKKTKAKFSTLPRVGEEISTVQCYLRSISVPLFPCHKQIIDFIARLTVDLKCGKGVSKLSCQTVGIFYKICFHNKVKEKNNKNLTWRSWEILSFECTFRTINFQTYLCWNSNFMQTDRPLYKKYSHLLQNCS